jgi:hypothetical protein
MKTVVEEVISVRYMLQCLVGVKVASASLICGDTMGVVHDATIKDSLLKKKHGAIYYHKVMEAAAAGIVDPTKTPGVHNYADVLTKCQMLKAFCMLVDGFMSG